MKNLEQLVKERILILDGAMGTMIPRKTLTEEDYRGTRFAQNDKALRGNVDVLNITRPDIIANIHRRYLEAGADIITTNTFSSQRISQSDYGLEDFSAEMATAGVRIARELADQFSTEDKPRFVAGSIGPSNKSCSISPDVNDPAKRNLHFSELQESYVEQMVALLSAGVDALLIETIFDTLNAKAAICAAEQAMKAAGRQVPLMLSVTVSDQSGHTLSGQTLDAFLTSIGHAKVFSVGLNCSFGADLMLPFLREMALSPYYISAYPNAGLPNALGEYDQTPELMAQQMAQFVDEGLVNIIGGCCGTTDAFIAKYPQIVAGKAPHCPAPPSQNLCLSGLERLELTPERRFINVGERCNVAGSRKFLRLISEKNYDEALAIARKQVEDGALVLDVNMDDGLLDAKAEMCHFLNLMMSDPDIARVPVMIDSSKWEVIDAALQCVQGKSIVNSISLKEGEKPFLQRAARIKQMGAAVIVMAFDEQGQATTFERKIEVCQRAYKLLVEQVVFAPKDIIFDPNVLAVGTGIEEHANYALDFIRATEWIRQNLPGAHVSGGVSNLSFAFRGNNYLREAIHAVFLYHAMAKGMDFGIVNPAAKVTYDDIDAPLLEAIEDLLLNRRPDATDRLLAIAPAPAPKGAAQESAGAEKQASQTVEERLANALIHGIPDHLEQDLAEALAMPAYANPVSIIEGPLMDAMNEVGRRFGEGRMFLPQVVKTARTMKRAVAILQPKIEQSRSEQTAANGTIVLGTVKGDVHDIGKNIVSVILSCNNYRIIDLGVMVPAEDIVAAAEENHADIIALSGLITPSLEEMTNVAKLLQQRGLHIPLMIGGATTSKLHTALRIATVYDAPVVWMKDASQNVLAAAQLLSPTKRQAYVDQLRQRQAELRAQYQAQQDAPIPLDEARKRKPNLF